MTEAEHVAAIVKATRECARASATETVKRSKRDRAIRDSRGHIPLEAAAVAANINKQRIIAINQHGEPEPREVEPVQSLGVVSLNASYPCHPEVSARFPEDESMDPALVMFKPCPRCRTPWKISRKVLAATSRGRVDELQWDVVTLDDTRRPA